MSVFDDIPRSDASPASHSESHARFLNRVHTPFWASVRTLIDDWFSHLPAEVQPDVRARLRSADNRHHTAAFWELYLHETLTRSGLRVTCHPEITGTDRRPDFLAEAADHAFYVEARAVADADDVTTAERRRTRVYDSLDRLDSPNFFLWIDVYSEGESDLPTRPLRTQLEAWLAALDPDDIANRLRGTDDITTLTPFEWVSEGWHLAFRPWPKAPGDRGDPEVRPLGVFGPGEAYMIDDVTPLKKALADKGSAYGSLELPFVVAVRTSRFSHSEFDVTDALYGSSQVQFGRTSTGETVTREVRAPDGYWYGGSAWHHRHVSAVLIADGLHPWTVSSVAPTLWEHPDPLRPVIALPVWRRAVPDSGALTHLEPAVQPHELLGLPRDWPGGDPFDPYPAARP